MSETEKILTGIIMEKHIKGIVTEVILDNKRFYLFFIILQKNKL